MIIKHNATVVTLNPSQVGDIMFYTLDGSEPASTNPNAIQYSGPFSLDYSCTIKVREYTPDLTNYSNSLVDVFSFVCNNVVIQNTGLSVTLTSSTVGASIYYGLDGGEVNNLYSGSFDVDAGTLVTAKAVKVGYVDSGDSSATIGNLVVVPPTFSLDQTAESQGNYYNGLVITLNSNPSNDPIYFIKGSTGITDNDLLSNLIEGNLYSSPLGIEFYGSGKNTNVNPLRVKFCSVHNGIASSVVTQDFSFKYRPPVLSKVSGIYHQQSYPNDIRLTMESPDDPHIIYEGGIAHYTFYNSEDMTKPDIPYKYNAPYDGFLLDNFIVRAMTRKDPNDVYNVGLLDSDEIECWYKLDTLYIPGIQPSAGLYPVTPKISLANSNTFGYYTREESVGTIFYTLDGTDPDTVGIEYTGGDIVISPNTVVKAIVKDNTVDASGNPYTRKSDVVSREYRVVTLSPSLAPGSYEGVQDLLLTVDMNTEEFYNNCTIAYTTDGTVPTFDRFGTVVNGIQYFGEVISLSSDVVIKAVIKKNNIESVELGLSPVYTYEYKISSSPLKLPYADNKSGNYPIKVKVSITNPNKQDINWEV